MSDLKGITNFDKAQASTARIMQDATPPPECGNVPAAPARGAMLAQQQYEVQMTDDGRPVTRPIGELDRMTGRQMAARKADGFAKMQCAADKRNSDADPLFSVGQIAAGRAYEALAERCAGRGYSCASLEARVDGGGGDGFMDAVGRDARRLACYHAALASLSRRGPGGAPPLCPGGMALTITRSTGPGDKRRAVSVRDLVDAVCIGHQSVGTFLKRKGWDGSSKNRKRLMRILRAALDAMRDI